MITPEEKARVILDMHEAILLTKAQTDPDWAAKLLREFAEALTKGENTDVLRATDGPERDRDDDQAAGLPVLGGGRRHDRGADPAGARMKTKVDRVMENGSDADE